MPVGDSQALSDVVVGWPVSGLFAASMGARARRALDENPGKCLALKRWQ